MYRTVLTILSLFVTCEFSAASITLDFSPDARGFGFFERNPSARAALEQAASDLSAVLDTPLLDMTTADVTNINATVGQQSEVIFQWSMSYSDPSTGQTTPWDPSTLSGGEVRIFVGMQPIPDSSVLGLGGTTDFSMNFQGSGLPGELGPAFREALAASNNIMSRGAGPVIGRVEVTDVFETEELFDAVVGAFGGTLAMDIDTNDDSLVDSDQQLDAFWHFDHTTDVPDDKTDFYSVALHELLHSIGLGGAEAWDDLVDGRSWLGPAATGVNGDGANLVSADGGHFIQTASSPRLVDGELQSPAIAPNIRQGQRLLLTELDVAALQDIGWITKEPALGPIGDFDGNGLLDVNDIQLLAGGLESQDLAFDLNGDNQIDGTDRDQWVRAERSTWYGDADLDGEFNSTDIVLVFTSAKFETGEAATWATGDWNLDGQFDSSDMIVAFADGGFEVGPRQAVPVPEPNHIGILLLTPLMQRRFCTNRRCQRRRHPKQ